MQFQFVLHATVLRILSRKSYENFHKKSIFMLEKLCIFKCQQIHLINSKICKSSMPPDGLTFYSNFHVIIRPLERSFISQILLKNRAKVLFETNFQTKTSFSNIRTRTCHISPLNLDLFENNKKKISSRFSFV